MNYNTEILSPTDENIEKAGRLLGSGEVVGIPTETVYGLAADATNPDAVSKIFVAKGRPQDNPLIVHIADKTDIEKYAKDIPEIAYRLADKFWPGPLTMVLPKKDIIPKVTSGGLDTVGIRFPSNPIAQKIIKVSGLPLAAPSANLSGKPSTTTAKHVYDDMNGRISAIVDGGACSVGVESTVISFSGEDVIILRPGFISKEDLLTVADNVIIDKGVLSEMSEDAVVASPGMKYKHYSPKANVVIVEGEYDNFLSFFEKNYSEGIYAMIFGNETNEFPYPHFSYGETDSEQAVELFNKLRMADEMNVKTVYVRCPSKDGVGLAVYNRLIRAAGFEVIKL